jgi:hypothetical protein
MSEESPFNSLIIAPPAKMPPHVGVIFFVVARKMAAPPDMLPTGKFLAVTR